MSLEYYLFCREKYSLILKYLEGIDDLCNDVINESKNNNINLQINCNIFFDYKCRSNAKDKITKLKNDCEKHIFKMCSHEFIDDLIDINPDRSLNITYCKFCGHTKQNT